MGCLFCGKEIGPFRQLRDSEFCSSVHRKRYGERLGRALGQLAAPDPVPTGLAGFLTALSPLDNTWQLSRGRWEFGYSSHQTQVGDICPVLLNPPLGSRFMASAGPRAGSPPQALRRKGNVGTLLREVVSPSDPPPAILGRGIAASGILRPIEPAVGPAEIAARPSLAESEGWAPRQVEIAAAGREMPRLTETFWESCATIAPGPAERWLSLVVAKEPVMPVRPARIPRFAMAAETAECFRDAGTAPPPPAETWMPGMAAQAAERWIQPAVAEALAAGCAAVAPSFKAAILSAAPEVAGWAAVPPAEAVERWIQPAVAASLATGSLDVRMQPFGLAAERSEVLRDPAEAPPPIAESWAPPAAAEPVESWLRPASAEAFWAIPVSIPEPAIAATTCAPELSGAVPSLAAEAAERWIEPVKTEAFAVGEHAPETLPFALTASCPDIFRDPADAPPPPAETWARIPAAEPVERWLQAGSAAHVLRAQVPVLAPQPSIAALYSTPRMAGAVPGPAAEAVERWMEPVSAQSFAAPSYTIRTQPFTVAGTCPSILRDPADVPPPVREEWMPAPAAEPVERWVEAATAAALAPVLSCRLRSLDLQAVEPFVPFIPQFARPHAAEPAAAFVMPAFSLLPMHPQVVFPRMPQTIARGTEDGEHTHSLLEAKSLPALEAAPVESMPAAQKAPIPIRSAPAILPAQERPSAAARLSTAGVSEIYPAAARAGSGAPPATRLNPVATLGALPPAGQIERPAPRVPEAEIYSLEYYSQRGTGSPSRRLSWAAPGIPPAALRFQMKPVFETVEEQAPPKPQRKGLAIAEIFSLPEARRQSSQSSLGYAGKIAAGIMVAISLWFGARVVNFGRPPETVARESSSPQRSAEQRPLVARGAAPQSGPLAGLRQAIAKRASVEVGDTFRGGMESWGTGSKEWAPGWSHSPDGYVRVGDLALFRPTQNFADYRLEFYGQIEKKSMGWVVRAHDKQNYYAMKFTVVEPGLRPIIAMVHYPVVGGKKGHKIETPLSVMVHNNTPYHVTVDVKGNHFVASIEGEQVESWTDDAPASGAVGFFSEAGEAARLYWAKVSKNQDWLGRFCSYLAGDDNRRTAELWNPALPPEAPAPPDPRPHDFVLTACEVSPEENTAPARGKIAKNWRIPIWIS